jgi:hypothetical protein
MQIKIGNSCRTKIATVQHVSYRVNHFFLTHFIQYIMQRLLFLGRFSL